MCAPMLPRPMKPMLSPRRADEEKARLTERRSIFGCECASEKEGWKRKAGGCRMSAQRESFEVGCPGK